MLLAKFLVSQLKYILNTECGRVHNKFQKSVCKFHILAAAIVV